MKKIKFLFLILLYQLTFGQTASEKLIHGKIMVESGQVAGVTIINLVNEKSTSSDTNGEFYILAKADDLLVFSSVNLEYHRKQIEEEDLKQEVIIIKMTSKVTELKEVIVNKHPQINAVALGISPKGIKKYTPAERRLKTAGDFKPIHLLGLLGGSLAVDPILNAISGRTKMLKKELEVEKKERLLLVLGSLFDDKYFSNTLKIPAEYIKGFKYYCIENPKFREVLNSKNKTKIEFLIVPLAAKFNEIISDEN
jgi:mannose/fructose/N-acetylgalactosamine-specific phosphotransferase system component IIB